MGTPWTTTITDAQAKNAIWYATARVALGRQGLMYDLVFRSCTVYVHDVLTVAGVQGLPPRPADNDTTRPNQVLAIALYRFMDGNTQ